jgi:Flp pilus assembly protein TadD
MLTMLLAILMAAGNQADPGVAPASTQAEPGQPDAVDQMLQHAFTDVKAGRNADALAYLDPLAVAVIERTKKESVPGYCAQSAAEAKGYLARTTTASPTVNLIPARLCTILFLRAYVLVNLKRMPEAIEQLRQLIALEPDFPHYQVEYASALRQIGDMDGALAAYRHAVEISAPIKEYDLDRAGALRGIGFILTERGDLSGAEKAYHQSLELAPGHPVALNELTYIARLRATGEKGPSQTMESSTNPADAHVPK